MKKQIKQSSVDWLFEKMDELIPLAYQELTEDLLSQALQMHQEEIIESWKDGEGHLDNDSQEEAEWYYCKIYGDGK